MMPMKRELYPDNWEEISHRIRFERAGNRCEWCGAANGFPSPVTGSKVVLTVAHLGIAKPDGTPGDKEDKQDCREENLAALCQRCHLNYDRPEILVKVRARIRQKRIDQALAQERAGQLRLMS